MAVDEGIMMEEVMIEEVKVGAIKENGMIVGETEVLREMIGMIEEMKIEEKEEGEVEVEEVEEVVVEEVEGILQVSKEKKLVCSIFLLVNIKVNLID